MRFFFDNNLPPKITRSLHALVEPEHEVIHLKHLFPSGISDVEWMKQLAGQQDWIIVSGDLRIRKNPHEIHAWKAAGHTTFFLKAGWINLDFWTQAWKFNKCFPEIITTAKKARPGTAFWITTNGKIEPA